MSKRNKNMSVISVLLIAYFVTSCVLPVVANKFFVFSSSENAMLGSIALLKAAGANSLLVYVLSVFNFIFLMVPLLSLFVGVVMLLKKQNKYKFIFFLLVVDISLKFLFPVLLVDKIIRYVYLSKHTVVYFMQFFMALVLDFCIIRFILKDNRGSQ